MLAVRSSHCRPMRLVRWRCILYATAIEQFTNRPSCTNSPAPHFWIYRFIPCLKGKHSRRAQSRNQSPKSRYRPVSQDQRHHFQLHSRPHAPMPRLTTIRWCSMMNLHAKSFYDGSKVQRKREICPGVRNGSIQQRLWEKKRSLESCLRSARMRSGLAKLVSEPLYSDARFCTFEDV